MELADARKKIDEIDEQIIELFEQRMRTSAEVAACKRAQGLPILDAKRERDVLTHLAGKSEPAFKSYVRALYSTIFELSKAYQGKLLNKDTALYADIRQAIDKTNQVFPKEAKIACQGIEGAYSQAACEKLFAYPEIEYYSSFSKVFNAIDSGLCQYGVLPLENSTAGSVSQVYDLMIEHNFYIIRSVRVKIDHNLMVNGTASLAELTEICSHEQAINQCAKFLKNLPGHIKVTPVANTAMAAEMVAKSGRKDLGAICSKACADLYGLTCLESGVQDEGNNYTRFICISKNLEIYPGADKTSLMLVTPHKPGALYQVLSRFYALGINLIKLESRPLPERDFEFMFYFDVEGSVYSPEFAQLICELDGLCDDFKYLGSYSQTL